MQRQFHAERKQDRLTVSCDSWNNEAEQPWAAALLYTPLINARRALYRSANHLLGTVNLTLSVKADDFDYRLEDRDSLQELFSALSRPIREWINTQSIVPAVMTINDLPGEIEHFYQAFLRTPFRTKTGGSRFNNLLWLNIVSRVMKPSLIVDSGTFQGASAWALSQGSPSSRVLSFDIDMSRLLSRSASVEYIEADWTTRDFTGLDVSRGLCYFDDHLDQVRRLLEARQGGFPVAIFDDDFPVTSVAPMAHDGAALPKIEFVLDDTLLDRSHINWSHNGSPRSFPIDHAYLDKGRAAILKTERLPNTSLITGIHQTPYRIVAIKET